MEGTPLLRLFLPRPGFTRYVMQRSPGTNQTAQVGLRLFNIYHNCPVKVNRSGSISMYLKVK